MFNALIFLFSVDVELLDCILFIFGSVFIYITHIVQFFKLFYLLFYRPTVYCFIGNIEVYLYSC